MSALDKKRDNFRKASRLKLQYPRWVEITAKKIVNQEIVDVIHDKMRKAFPKYSKKIIDRTFLESANMTNEGEIIFTIVSDYESEKGFEVSEAREEGTVAVFVKPVFKKFLRWIDFGIFRFSRGHLRRGVQATNIIDITVEQNIDKAQIRLDEETDQLINDILKT